MAYDPSDYKRVVKSTVVQTRTGDDGLTVYYDIVNREGDKFTFSSIAPHSGETPKLMSIKTLYIRLDQHPVDPSEMGIVYPDTLLFLGDGRFNYNHYKEFFESDLSRFDHYVIFPYMRQRTFVFNENNEPIGLTDEIPEPTIPAAQLFDRYCTFGTVVTHENAPLVKMCLIGLEIEEA